MTDVPSSEEFVREAAQVAHDLNNLVLVMRGYCSILLRRAEDDVTREQLQRIDDAASQAALLSARLLPPRPES